MKIQLKLWVYLTLALVVLGASHVNAQNERTDLHSKIIHLVHPLVQETTVIGEFSEGNDWSVQGYSEGKMGSVDMAIQVFGRDSTIYIFDHEGAEFEFSLDRETHIVKSISLMSGNSWIQHTYPYGLEPKSDGSGMEKVAFFRSNDLGSTKQVISEDEFDKSVTEFFAAL